MDDIGQIAVVGTGLLGASVGLGLKACGYTGRIAGVVRRASVGEAAVSCGAVDWATTDLAEAVADSGLVIVAVPLGGFESVFERLAGCDHERLVVTDVGSTKQSVCEAAARYLPGVERFVGSHPMAGSEQQGPEAGRADLFAGKPCIVTPQEDTAGWALQLVERLWRSLGMNLLRMSPLEHDRQVAATSHLPHAASALLVHAAMQLGGWDVASTGFRDTTRLASSNPPMRLDILKANRRQVIEALEAYGGGIERLRGLLEAQDWPGLLKLLEQAQAARERWLSGGGG